MGEAEDRQLAEWLASKRDAFDPGQDFADRVMGGIRKVTPAAAPRRRLAFDDWWPRLVESIRALTPRTPVWTPAALALLAIGYLGVRPWLETGPDTRIKGEGYRFAMVRQVGDGDLDRVDEGDSLRSGDKVQALYWLPESAYVELLSLDEQGKASCFSCGRGAGRYAPAAGAPLPFGLELDASAGRELYVLAVTEEWKNPEFHRALLEGAWKSAGGDLDLAAARLRKGAREVRCLTLLVRKGRST